MKKRYDQYNAKRKDRRTFPEDVQAYKDLLYANFEVANEGLHGLERERAWSRFLHRHFWSKIYQRIGQANRRK